MKRVLFVILALSLSAMAQASPGFTKINTSPITGTNFTDAACANLNTCFYQVTTVDANGFESGPATCATTAICVGGNTVIATMPSSGTHTVAVSWTASTTPSVTYNVYRHVGPLPASGANAVVN